MLEADLATLFAEAQGRSLFFQLSPVQRLSVAAALSLILIIAALLILFTRASARLTRWYMHRPVVCHGADANRFRWTPRVARRDKDPDSSGSRP